MRKTDVRYAFLPTLRRLLLPAALRMNATPRRRRGYRRTTYGTLYNEPSLDVGMAHR